MSKNRNIEYLSIADLITSSYYEDFTYDYIRTGEKWDYPFPTLQFSGETKEEFTGPFALKYKSQKELIEALYKTYPFLKFLQSEKVVLAGGALANFISNTDMEKFGSDFDFFLYDTKLQPAIKCIGRVFKKIRNTWKHKKVQYYRSGQAVSMILDDKIKFQFVLRSYKEPSEVIDSFDIGPSMVWFDGANVHFNELSKLCYEYSINLINPMLKGKSFEYRIVKYAKRGFRPVLVNLNLNEWIPDNNGLPNLPFKSSKGIDDKIPNLIRVDSYETSEESGDYDIGNIVQKDTMTKINAKRLFYKIPVLIYYGTDYSDIMSSTKLKDKLIDDAAEWFADFIKVPDDLSKVDKRKYFRELEFIDDEFDGKDREEEIEKVKKKKIKDIKTAGDLITDSITWQHAHPKYGSRDKVPQWYSYMYYIDVKKKLWKDKKQNERLARIKKLFPDKKFTLEEVEKLSRIF